jgi:hypothetical protein
MHPGIWPSLLFELAPFGLIFLLEDESAQVRTKNLDSRFVKLVGEDFGIQVGLILNKLPTLPDSPRED